MEQTIDIALPELIKLIKELQRVNANFDFTRYSFRGKRKYQFYNAPLGEDEQWQKKEKSEDERMHVDWISEMPIVPNIILIDNTIGIIAIFNEPKALSISLSRFVKLGKTSIYETWFG